jgi:hypothetical protein
MAVSHVKSNAIADFTGTVTVFNSLGATATTQATALVRPSDWNSAHNQYMTIAGNTAGASTISGTNIVLQGGNNVTLSANASTIIFSGPDLAGYLTTAAQSNHSHGNPTLALTNLTGTTASASNGLTLSLSAASQSVQTQNSVSVQGSTGAISFANSNGITFGGNASTITASHNGLTTAALSNHSHGNPTLALTNLTGTTASNSAGLTLSLSANAPGAATLTAYAVSNTTQSTSGTIPGGSLSFGGAGGVSAGISNGSVVISGPALTSLSVTGALSASSNGSTISLGVGTVTMSATGNTTQGSSGTVNLNALNIQGTGGVSVGVSNGSIVISGATGGGGNLAISGGAESRSTGTINFSNSNGVTFGLSNNGVMTASVAAVGGAQTGISGIGVSNTTYTSGTVIYSAQANVTLGSSVDGASQYVRISVAAPGAGGGIALANTQTTYTSGTAQLFEAGGAITIASTTGQRFNFSVPATSSLSGTGAISLSTNGSTISIGVGTVTASAIGNTTQTSSGTINLNGLVVSGAGGLSAGFSNGTLILSGNTAGGGGGVGLNTAQTNVTWTVNSSGISLDAAAYLTSQSNQAVSNSAGSFTFQTLNFSNANNVTFGTSAGGIITASVAAPGGGGYGWGAGGGTVTSGTLVFSNSNGITFGINGQTLTASHNGITTGRASNDAVGLNTALTAGPLAWTVNSSGISLNAGSAAGTSTGFTGGASISGSMTHNTAGLALSLSHPAWITTAAQSSVSNVSAVIAATNNTGGGTATLSGAVSFSNANSATFYTSAGNAIVLSLPAYLTTQSAQAVSNSAGSFTFQTLNFSNANNVTFGTSAGSIITASVAAPGGGGGAALSAGTQSVSTGTVAFANSNGITFGMSGSNQITASYNSTLFAGTGTSITGAAAITLNSNGLQFNGASMAGTTSGFTGANISLSMTHNTSGLAISASVAAPGAAAENNAIALLGANTAGNTTATGSTIGWSGQNITLSGTNASQIVISAPATSSLVGTNGISISTAGSTISVYPNPSGNAELFEMGNNTAFSTMGQNTIYLQQFIPQDHVTFAAIERRFSGSSVSSTNSQAASHTYSYALYSRGTGANSSIYSQIAQSSIFFAASFNSNTQAGWTVSQGAASVTNTSAGTVNMSAITGYKHMYFPFGGTVIAGSQYAIAMRMSSATAVGTSPLRIGLMEMTMINNLTVGRLDTDAGFSISNASRIGDFGQGVYSVTSSNLPATIALSGLTNAVSQARMYLQLD